MLRRLLALICGFSGRNLKALVDAGDIIGAAGAVKRTEKGELSVVAASVQILTKSLQPLPDKWHGLADIEKRYRQRWGLLLASPEDGPLGDEVLQVFARALQGGCYEAP